MVGECQAPAAALQGTGILTQCLLLLTSGALKSNMPVDTSLEGEEISRQAPMVA